MPTEVGPQKGRQNHKPLARLGLGRPLCPLAGGQLRGSPPYPDGQVVEIDVLPTQLGLFLRPERSVGTEEDHQPPARPEGIGERVDLVDGGDRPFGRRWP